MDVGTELRLAREAAGLSREQLSARTKIQLAKIDALEANAYERLPDGIYLDGLVRTYAREVGIDGDQLVRRLRADAPALAADTRDLDTFESEASSPDHPSGISPIPVDPRPHFAEPHVMPPPRRRGDLLRFGLPLLALIAAAGWGAYLYESSRPFDGVDTGDVPAISRETADAARAAAGEPEATDAGERDAASARHEAAEPSEPAEGSQETIDPVESGAPVTPEASEPTAPPPAPEAPAAPEADPSESPGHENSPLSGFWTLATRVESSSYRNFEGLELGYLLELRQDGTRITGSGVKTLENGRSLPGKAQTPITVNGTMDGDRLTLTFTERGSRRTSEGKMILDVHDDGVLRGRFSSDAARSTGTAEARRPEG